MIVGFTAGVVEFFRVCSCDIVQKASSSRFAPKGAYSVALRGPRSPRAAPMPSVRRRVLSCTSLLAAVRASSGLAQRNSPGGGSRGNSWGDTRTLCLMGEFWNNSGHRRQHSIKLDQQLTKFGPTRTEVGVIGKTSPYLDQTWLAQHGRCLLPAPPRGFVRVLAQLHLTAHPAGSHSASIFRACFGARRPLR